MLGATVSIAAVGSALAISNATYPHALFIPGPIFREGGLTITACEKTDAANSDVKRYVTFILKRTNSIQ